MMKKIIFVMALSGMFPPIVMSTLGQNSCTIDFGEYYAVTPDPLNCTFRIGNVPWIIKDWFTNDTLCDNSSEDVIPAYAIAQKEDLPYVGKMLEVKCIQQGCVGGVIVYAYYVTGDTATSFIAPSEVFIVENYDSLDYLEFFEPECGLPGGDGVPSIIVVLSDVKTDPDPVACSSSAVSEIEGLHSDPQNLLRKDYHFYVVEGADALVCNVESYSGPNDCTIEGVWEFVKSNNIYQVPTYEDLASSYDEIDGKKASPYYMINKSFKAGTPGPYGVPVSNCAMVNIPPSKMRVFGGLVSNIIPFFLQITPITTCLDNINVGLDPVMVVVDEENKRMINYTLPGHILYPGKIERCVISDDCGENIRIVTKGSGFHSCGDGWLGYLYARTNEKVGKDIFRNLSKRVRDAFNN